MPRMPRAIIFVPRAADSPRWWKLCVEHCHACGYHVVSVVTRWEDVQRVIELDHVEVVVAALREHFPPDRTPREEVAAEQQKEISRPESEALKRPRRKWAAPTPPD